jgi:hypothetical protein
MNEFASKYSAVTKERLEELIRRASLNDLSEVLG